MGEYKKQNKNKNTLLWLAQASSKSITYIVVLQPVDGQRRLVKRKKARRAVQKQQYNTKTENRKMV